MNNIFVGMAAFFLLVAAVIVAPHLGWDDAREFGLFCVFVGALCCFMALVINK